MLIDAILQARLYLWLTTSLVKRSNDSAAPRFSYIRDDLDPVYHCIQGHCHPRQFLKWAGIERWAVQLHDKPPYYRQNLSDTLNASALLIATMRPDSEDQ